jgi:hypothetical protein
MIIPTAADMLKSVETTFETVIKPDLTSTATRSAAATVGHMLRIATLRIETEGQILHDERLRLNGLLPQIAAWLATSGQPVTAAIAARPALDAAIYPGLAIMAAEVGALRQGVCDALAALQGRTLDTQGERLLSELHGYIAWQLEQEGRMIDPATIGHGPRR